MGVLERANIALKDSSLSNLQFKSSFCHLPKYRKGEKTVKIDKLFGRLIFMPVALL